MTRMRNARLAGCAFLFYIVIGIVQSIIGRGVSSGAETGARLASMALHATQVRINVVLGLIVFVNALALAVALYGITRDEDNDLAVMALLARAGEALLGATQSLASLGLLWLATTVASATSAPDGHASYALADFLFKLRGWNVTLGSFLFSFGSLFFSYLLLRGRMVPVVLAWLGVVASLLLVVLLPAQLVGLLQGPATQIMWAPMAAFEVPLAIWLLVRGVAPLRTTNIPQGGDVVPPIE